LKAGNLLPSGTRSEGAEWGGLLSDLEEAYPEKIKTVVSPTDYGKEEVEQGKTFYISNDIKEEERAEYARTLKEYSDVFAWAPTDLEGIPAELGEHSIDLQEGAVLVRQRQYRLNPRYLLMMKEKLIGFWKPDLSIRSTIPNGCRRLWLSLKRWERMER
jgi:hypothetical protein